MRQIDVSAFRKNLFKVIDRLPDEGTFEIVRNGRVVATLGKPPRKISAAKPVIDKRRLGRVCKKHHIKRLALFGSILRDDFGPDSDVDVLVDPEPGHLTTLSECVQTRDALVKLFGREVDLLKRAVVENSSNALRKRHILESARVVYEAA